MSSDTGGIVIDSIVADEMPGAAADTTVGGLNSERGFESADFHSQIVKDVAVAAAMPGYGPECSLFLKRV